MFQITEESGNRDRFLSGHIFFDGYSQEKHYDWREHIVIEYPLR